MALVPFTGAHLVATGASVPQVKLTKKALQKAAEVHAAYGVPYATGGGKAAFMMAPRLELFKSPRPPKVLNAPRRQSKSAASTVAAPVALGTTTRSTPPRAGGTGKSFRITHSALFGSVAGGTSFSVQTFRINPGLPDMFPWLSGLSGSFDMYRIVSMQVKYVPITGTDTEGAMYIAYDPDPEDTPPTAKAQVMNYATSVTSPVWKGVSLNIPSLGTKFVRRGEVIGVSRNTYDNGQLFVCQQGAPSGTNGDLFVTYTVELYMPHVASNNNQLYWSQMIRKSAGSVARATVHGTLPPLSYGDIIVDAATISYPSSGVVRYPLRNVVSYDNGSGTRAWRALLRILIHAGTGVAAPTVTCSDANATVTAQESVANAGATAGGFTWSITWTAPPAANSYLNVDYTTSTTITGIHVNFDTVPDAVTGVYDS